MKYTYPASQIPNNTSLAKRNTIHCKQSFQNRNEISFATREFQFNKSNFPPIRRHSTNFFKSHYPKTEPVLLASNLFGNQLTTSPSKNSYQFKHILDINHINKNKHSMPSKSASPEFASLSHPALRINPQSLQLHFAPLINSLIPQGILAPQVLPKLQPRHPQPRHLMSALP